MECHFQLKHVVCISGQELHASIQNLNTDNTTGTGLKIHNLTLTQGFIDVPTISIATLGSSERFASVTFFSQGYSDCGSVAAQSFPTCPLERSFSLSYYILAPGQTTAGQTTSTTTTAASGGNGGGKGKG